METHNTGVHLVQVMKFGSADTSREQGRALAKTMVRDTMRELLLTDPEFRDSLRPVLKSIIREILQEERIVSQKKPGG
jgi:dephospho-CoA kinase